MDLADVEIAHFERVSFMIKNFDLVFVYKDYSTFKRINSVPMESLDMIKTWLDEMDILYSEGPIPLNWTTILQQIREDIGSFISQGGWGFLHDDQATDGEG